MASAVEYSARLAVRTANDRLKESFAPLLWGSVALSTAAHFVLISDDISIAAVTFEENPIEMLPPAPDHSVENTSLEDQPTFTPYEVKPELSNPGEMQRLLERSYPSIFKDAGIGGKVVLWVYIDESGAVKNTKVVSSTGDPELDAVAEGLLREKARFTPAYNRDERVGVWIQIPVDFATRAGGA